MNKQEMVKWLESLYQDIGSEEHIRLWGYEQALNEIIETLIREIEEEE